MDKEKELILKLARAKAFYTSLCNLIEISNPIITGKIRGSKKTWNCFEKSTFRGKTFFDKVKGIGEFVNELPKEGTNEKSSIS